MTAGPVTIASVRAHGGAASGTFPTVDFVIGKETSPPNVAQIGKAQ
jgi:hypothetical protein